MLVDLSKLQPRQLAWLDGPEFAPNIGGLGLGAWRGSINTLERGKILSVAGSLCGLGHFSRKRDTHTIQHYHRSDNIATVSLNFLLYGPCDRTFSECLPAAYGNPDPISKRLPAEISCALRQCRYTISSCPEEDLENVPDKTGV